MSFPEPAEIVMGEAGSETEYWASAKPEAVNLAAATVPVTEGRVPMPPEEVLVPVADKATVKLLAPAAMLPKLRSMFLTREIGVTMVAPALAVCVAVFA